MITFIITIFIILFFFLFLVIIDRWITKTKPIVVNKPVVDNVLGDLVQIDKHGKKYRLVKKTRDLSKKIYVYGNLNGKYWGELDEQKADAHFHSKFYQFDIYEAELSNSQNQFTPFAVQQEGDTPNITLDAPLPITLKKDGKEYAVTLNEPQIVKVKFDRKLHQHDGREVFGTIDSEITGYILDKNIEEYTEIEYIQDKNDTLKAAYNDTTLFKPTGNIERKGNYTRVEYYHLDGQSTFWGDWIYTKPDGKTQPTTLVPAGILLSLFALIFFGILFVLSIKLALFVIAFLAIIILLFVLQVVPSSPKKWIGLLLLFLFILFCIKSCVDPFDTKPKQDSTKYDGYDDKQLGNNERSNQYNDNGSDTTKKLMDHYRIWHNYAGDTFEGTFWVETKDYNNAINFKEHLTLEDAASSENYDNVMYKLYQNDALHLNGMYQLFDSLLVQSNDDAQGFAEMIVCFVQDIPYTILLKGSCNPTEISDPSVKEYLANKKSPCEGYQKFGVKSPVEFVSTLNADCDTRTLFLYTVLKHYNYDVILLTSEYYNHSLIGINLPFDGTAFEYKNKRYVVWETTGLNFKPGMLPDEISDIKYWRVSLD